MSNCAVSPLFDAPMLCQLSVADLTAGYERGDFTPNEVVEAALGRAEDVQPTLNAFALLDMQGARRAAAEATARWAAKAPRGPLDGVPGTVKDIVWVRGLPVTYGSQAIDAVMAEEDAPAVAGLRGAGVVILGLTTTPEFGWKAVTDSARYGITRNPWNIDLTPGGSSGGAAAAAAAGAGVVHLGTDGGGSIRIPGSFAGVAGIKPTFGRVAAYPLSAFGTVAHIGPMARTAADTALGLQAMSGRDLRDWHQPPEASPLIPASSGWEGLRVGLWSVPARGTVAPEVASGFALTIARLQAMGAAVESISLPEAELDRIFRVHWFAGAAARLRMIPTEHHGQIDPGFREIAAEGARFSAADYLDASTARARFGAAMDQLLTEFDVIVSPGTPITAFTAGLEVPEGSGLDRWTEWAGFSWPINLSQQPAVVVPSGLTNDGLPLSLQIVGARGQDARVLALAAAYERTHPFKTGEMT